MDSGVRLDHLATWNEVCDALAYLSREAFALGHAREVDGELEHGGSDGMGTLGEELAWLRVAYKVLDYRLN